MWPAAEVPGPGRRRHCARLRAVTDLVLLHGGGHGSWCWGPLLEEWKTLRFPFERTFALDTPGAGTKRGQSTDGWTITTLAQSLNDELRAARVQDATFIGHSLAGVLMPVMAAQ